MGTPTKAQMQAELDTTRHEVANLERLVETYRDQLASTQKDRDAYEKLAQELLRTITEYVKAADAAKDAAALLRGPLVLHYEARDVVLPDVEAVIAARVQRAFGGSGEGIQPEEIDDFHEVGFFSYESDGLLAISWVPDTAGGAS